MDPLKGTNIGETPNTKGLPFDLGKLIKFGIVEKQFELADIKILMHTLTEDERQKALKLSGFVEDATIFTEKIKVPYLVYAIDRIDNTEFKDENSKKELHEALLKTQASIIDLLIMKYNEMDLEKLKNFENLKKKS